MREWERRRARGTGTLAAALALPLVGCSWLRYKNQFWTEPKTAARSRNSSLSASVCEYVKRANNLCVCVCVCACIFWQMRPEEVVVQIKAEFGEWRSPWD